MLFLLAFCVLEALLTYLKCWIAWECSVICRFIVFHSFHMIWSYFQRVKVYRLNEDGKWDDQGTGHVTVDYLEVWFFVSFFCILFLTWWLSIILYLWYEIKTLWLVVQRSEDLGLFVIDEEDNETLLLHRISSDDIYRKQEGILL